MGFASNIHKSSKQQVVHNIINLVVFEATKNSIMFAIVIRGYDKFEKVLICYESPTTKNI